MDERNIIRISMQYFAEDSGEDWDWNDDEPEEEDLTEEDGAEEAGEPEEEDPDGGNAPEENQPEESGEGTPAAEPAGEPQNPAAQTVQQTEPVRQSDSTGRIVGMVERLARASGMTVDQYVQAVERQSREQRIQAEVAKGIPREYAERLLQLEESEHQRREQEEAARREQESRKQYLDFAAAYPEVKELPKEVIGRIAAGETPLHAYLAYENAQLKQEIAALKKNGENRERSLGSLKNREGGEDGKDPFLAAFEEA